MIDDETVEAALTGIQASIIALVENNHARLVEPQSSDLAERLLRFSEIRRLGLDLAALADAASTIIRRSTIL